MNTRKFTLNNREELFTVLGPQDIYLRNLEKEFKVSIYVNHDPLTGNATLSIIGKGNSPDKAIAKIRKQLKAYYQIKGDDVGTSEDLKIEDGIYKTDSGQIIKPKTPNQKRYVEYIASSDITIAIGPAGTGKTYLASAMALAELKNNKIKKIILTRPIVESGERLGFLPGDISEKVHPYLKPLYDSFYSLLGPEKFHLYREQEIIETIPLAYMRGRTLDNSFMILDEAQNTTGEQIKMFLTRMGVGSKMVITGDITQIDLKDKKSSGLILILNILKKIEEIKIIYFDKTDVVRHPLVAKIIAAYEAWENKKG